MNTFKHINCILDHNNNAGLIRIVITIQIKKKLKIYICGDVYNNNNYHYFIYLYFIGQMFFIYN